MRLKAAAMLGFLVSAIGAPAMAQETSQSRCDRGWSSNDWSAVAAECANFADEKEASAKIVLSAAPTADPASIKDALRTASPTLLVASIAWARTAIGASKLKQEAAYENAYGTAVSDLKSVEEYGDTVAAQRAGDLLKLLQSPDFTTAGAASPLLATY